MKFIFVTDTWQLLTNRSLFDEWEDKPSNITEFQNNSNVIPIHDIKRYEGLDTCCEGHSFMFRDMCWVIH